MKKNILMAAALLMGASFCISAASPASDCKEIAMTKCTKEPSEEEMEQSDSCKSTPCKTRSCNTCDGDQSDASGQVKSRKSAAQRVVQGD